MKKSYSQELYKAYEAEGRRITLALEDYSKGLDEAKEALATVYKAAKMPVPTYVYLVDSPYQAHCVAALYDLAASGSKAGVKATCEAERRALEIAKAWGIKAGSKAFAAVLKESQSLQGLRIGSFATADHRALSFYQDHDPVPGLDYTAFSAYRFLQENYGGGFYGSDIVVLFRRPVFLNLIPTPGQDLLRAHCESGPYLRYADGTCLYALDGVIITEIEFPKGIDELRKQPDTVKRVLGIVNADQRAVLIKYIGAAYFEKALNMEVVDTYIETETSTETFTNKYELVYFTLEGQRLGPALRMTNPTTGIIHVEGVGSETYPAEAIKTCKDALVARRRGTTPKDTYYPPLRVA